MNVKDSIKKVGAVAASTLMVGMTMGAAQSLSEFPGMFVDDEGSPTAQVVVGSQGAVSDVVGAVNVAAALGQATIQTSEQTETVDVETSTGGIGWSVDGDGQTLDTRNDNLYFGQDIDNVRDTLTGDHLDALQTVSYTDDAGNQQEVDFYLRPQAETIQFDTSGESNTDPFMYVNNPSDPSATDAGLYELQANFEDGLEITNSDGTPNDDVLGEEIELFGKSFTISEDSFTSGNEGELILYGASDEYDLETGQSTTVTINGNEHTLEVRAVTDKETTAFYVDGQLREKTEGTTFSVDGTDVRVDDVIQTSSDNSQGLVTFSIGSEEYRIDVTGAAVQDSDDNDIEGTRAKVTGSDGDTNSGGLESSTAIDPNGGGSLIEISSITFGMGAADDDEDYVGVGETYQDPIFDGIAFSFGGLAPDAAQGPGETVDEVSFSTDGDDTVTASFTDGGDNPTLEWAYVNNIDQAGSGAVDVALEDSDQDAIEVREGADVAEDEYFLSDAGDFDHMWEVTSIDRDNTGSNIAEGDEATIDLRDTVTGATVEVDLDAYSGNDNYEEGTEEYYAGTEVIDGQTYKFVLEGENSQLGSQNSVPNFRVAWGDGSAESAADSTTVTNVLNTGDEVSLYPALDTDSDASVAFTKPMTTAQNIESGSITLELPSTESSDAKTLKIEHTQDGDSGSGNADEVTFTASSGATATAAYSDFSQATGEVFVEVGQVDYVVSLGGMEDGASAKDVKVTDFRVAEEQHSGKAFGATSADFDLGANADEDGDTNNHGVGPSALVIQPEDDNDQEHAYIHTPGVDTGEPEVDAGGSKAYLQYTGDSNGAAGYATKTLDSNDDMEVAYNFYGTHTMQDTGDQGSFTLHIPYQQAVAGAAFHGPEASFSMGGATGTGSGEVTYTGVTNEDIRGALPDLAKTDDQVTSSDRQNSHLILVGGPAVNTLVSDLADEGETWTTDEWRNEHVDEALLQVVEDAFNDGQHAMIVAGHSADDTRAAARYVSEWRSHQDTLEEAGMQYSPSSQEAPR